MLDPWAILLCSSDGTVLGGYPSGYRLHLRAYVPAEAQELLYEALERAAREGAEAQVLVLPWGQEARPAEVRLIPIRSATLAPLLLVWAGPLGGEAADLAKLGQLTAGVVHDLNNLLSSILGYTQLLRQSPEGAANPYLKTIEQAALDGAAIVARIREFLRKQEVRPEPIELRQILEACIELTRPRWHNEAQQRGISIRLEADLSETSFVLARPAELREVFLNLLLNAIDALAESGGLVRLKSRVRGPWIEVEIEDTGPGIAPEVLPRIFEPRFTTKGSQGTGMGLTISRHIVQRLGGEIEVKSAPGQGACFTVRLPRLSALPAPTAPSVSAGAPIPPSLAERSDPRRPGRMLVVDDEPAVRAVLAKLLRLEGHTVVEAASGEEALRELARAPFELVFTDLGMPHMDGRTLARRIRAQWPEVGIVLVTGYLDPTEESCPEVDVLLHKPFKLDEVRIAVKTARLKRAAAS
ncbi:MAG: hybrid sensor histidine kinase/response regulator [Bacteroidetes bacterium]|nr:hybrid sensor histidine kinase/response regulator [Rhodothermia bacterium]MCS7155061.1 hybrid sensor histidine kinase/response regulator [Bacteroidota bacterium]MCX7907345.1 hybrid sensor histidine kinase/response regulator [Bacteroidota bacterium]MDW8137928.1 hybrid sensor histidine kinase/response regulator [Bacteroidota bacterium]MDW8286220.1 hybrid sensor histidine kinase/response regulator [Bacteroidota bacterium]